MMNEHDEFKELPSEIVYACPLFETVGRGLILISPRGWLAHKLHKISERDIIYRMSAPFLGKGLSRIQFNAFAIPSALISLVALMGPVISAYNEQADIHTILKAEKAYCTRLNEIALDFVCLEEVSEKNTDVVKFIETIRLGLGTQIVEKNVIRKHTYLYDYQFVRKEGRKVENRLLLKQDGRDKREKVTGLKTTMFEYKNVLFGPINLLAADRQPFYDYETIGPEVLDGVDTTVIRASPKPGFSQLVDGGKIWVEVTDCSILKIVWNHDRMAQSAIIQDMAKRYKGTPLITQTMEFGFKKNGIRFPSRYLIEEAYVRKNGKKTVHSETVVLYKDYKFFTVETEIKYSPAAENKT